MYMYIVEPPNNGLDGDKHCLNYLSIYLIWTQLLYTLVFLVYTSSARVQ